MSATPTVNTSQCVLGAPNAEAPQALGEIATAIALESTNATSILLYIQRLDFPKLYGQCQQFVYTKSFSQQITEMPA